MAKSQSNGTFPLPCPVRWCRDDLMGEEEYIEHQRLEHSPLLYEDDTTLIVGYYDRI